MPAEQVARALGYPSVKTIYNHVYRALAAIRTRLERAGIDVTTFGTDRFDARAARGLLEEWLPRIEHPGVRAAVLRHLEGGE